MFASGAGFQQRGCLVSGKDRRGNTFDLAIDAFNTVIYALGSAAVKAIEWRLMPMFGTDSLPRLTIWILRVSDLILLLGLIRRSVILFDGLIKTMVQTWTVKSLLARVRRSGPEALPSSLDSRPDGTPNAERIDGE